jgi:AbrB family looped-hinge helix DNA binding protein
MLEENARVGKKYVVVIPSKIRREIGLKVGDVLRVRLEENRIVMEQLSNDPFKTLAEVVGKPYNEEVDEKKAEKWLRDASR